MLRVLDEIVRDTKAIARTFFGGTGVREMAMTMSHDGSQVLALFRLRQAAARAKIPFVDGALRRVQVALYGIEIAKHATLGEGVLFVHTVGVVIGGDSRIGDRVMFLGSNTLGSLKREDFPSIGDDVILGAGARILGRIKVGDAAAIGANAVVVRDVPAGSTAAGVPAVVRAPRGELQSDPGIAPRDGQR